MGKPTYRLSHDNSFGKSHQYITHQNTTLRRNGASGNDGSQSSDTLSQEMPDWNFHDGETGNTTHQYGEDDLVDQRRNRDFTKIFARIIKIIFFSV
jgi:hypothetical protein